jgi:hypothetical protein
MAHVFVSVTKYTSFIKRYLTKHTFQGEGQPRPDYTREVAEYFVV